MYGETKWEWGYNYNSYKQLIKGCEKHDFLLVPKKMFRLPLRIYLDKALNYIRYDHPLWVFVQYQNELVPVSVGSTPEILIINPDCYDYTIDENMREVFGFISQNQQVIKLFADNEISKEEMIFRIKENKKSNHKSPVDVGLELERSLSAKQIVVLCTFIKWKFVFLVPEKNSETIDFVSKMLNYRDYVREGACCISYQEELDDIYDREFSWKLCRVFKERALSFGYNVRLFS